MAFKINNFFKIMGNKLVDLYYNLPVFEPIGKFSLYFNPI